MHQPELGLAIKRERELVGVKQDELAHASGVSRLLLAQYEAGWKTPSMRRLKHIADTLGVSLARLLNECTVQRFLREHPNRRYIRRPKFDPRDAFTAPR